MFKIRHGEWAIIDIITFGVKQIKFFRYLSMAILMYFIISGSALEGTLKYITIFFC